MKLKILCLTMTFLFSNHSFAQRQCAQVLSAEESSLLAETFLYTNSWSSAAKKAKYHSKKDLNGFLIKIVSDYALAMGELPSKEFLELKIQELSETVSSPLLRDVLQKGLDDYFKDSKTPHSVEHIFKISGNARHKGFYKGKKDELKQSVADFFINHYRFPTIKELAQLKEMDAFVVETLIGDPAHFTKRTMSDMVDPEALSKMTNVLTKVFLRTLRQTDIPEAQRTQATTPLIGDLFQTLMIMAEAPKSGLPKALKEGLLDGRFKVKDLARLVGENYDSISPNQLTTPSIFKNIKDLENSARRDSPTAFKNYVPAEVVNPTRLMNLQEALKEKQGFLVTSINAGMPISEAMLATMLRKAEDSHYDIIVIPTGGILDGIPNILLKNPNIHILTHTVQNKFLKLWTIPILPKNQNPLASLNNPGQHEPMQTVIVGAPQLRMQTVPTGSNHLRHTNVWTTGSLNISAYPYRHAVQGRTSELAKNNHFQSFLVLEKADGESGFSGEGTANHWHVRPVAFVNDTNTGSGVAGFTDGGRQYYVRSDKKNYKRSDVKVREQEIDTIVLGDLHEIKADPVYMKQILDYIKSAKGLRRVVLHDPIDGLSHNRHEADSIGLLMEKFAKGELDYHGEMMSLVQFVNAITSARGDIEIIMADSNHSYWGQKLVSKALDVQNVINGRFLNELRNSQNVYETSDPLKYVFMYRNDYINRLPEEAKAKYLKDAILVEHPERVKVLTRGRAFVVGPNHRPVYINFHGHEGSGGAKGSAKSHAIGSPGSLTGDSHQTMIWNHWMSAGTTTALRQGYNDGGYSAWSNSFGVIYADGTKQVFIYSSEAQTFQARQGKYKMSADEFFGEYDIEVIPNDNNLYSGAIVDQHSHILKALSKKGNVND